jgi:hypothetical protein
MNDPSIPATPTDRDAPDPWSRVLRALRELAKQQDVSAHEVLQTVGCRKQELWRWSAPEGKHRTDAPMWVIRRLLDRLGFVAVVTPDEILLIPREQIPAG